MGKGPWSTGDQCHPGRGRCKQTGAITRESHIQHDQPARMDQGEKKQAVSLKATVYYGDPGRQTIAESPGGQNFGTVEGVRPRTEDEW